MEQNILYDTPFEVTEIQYNTIMSKCAGIVAGRNDGDKFYIKVWLMRYLPYIKKLLA